MVIGYAPLTPVKPAGHRGPGVRADPPTRGDRPPAEHAGGPGVAGESGGAHCVACRSPWEVQKGRTRWPAVMIDKVAGSTTSPVTMGMTSQTRLMKNRTDSLDAAASPSVTT